MRRALAVPLLAAVLWAPPQLAGEQGYDAGRKAYDEAEQRATGTNQARVRDLYRLASKEHPDPLHREKAAIAAAYRERRVFRNAAAARELLAPFDTADVWLERSHVEREVARDFAAARDAAQRSLALATTALERQNATLAAAKVTLAEARCPRDEAALRSAMAAIEATIVETVPRLEAARLMLQVAIAAGDRAAAVRALRLYYSDIPALVPASVPHRRALGLMLAKARLYPEAALVLADPCGTTFEDEESKDVLEYAATLARLDAAADRHYRRAATGDASARFFRSDVKRLVSPDARRRFGAVYSVQQRLGVTILQYSHIVQHEAREVRQYGYDGTIRFILLDGVLSNGYVWWLRDGVGDVAGWYARATVFEVRPVLANLGGQAWLRIADRGEREKIDRLIAAEERRDEERAKRSRIGPFRALQLRLDRQQAESLRGELAAQGLEGNALRDAFIARFQANFVDTAVWAHEGRHAIDRARFRLGDVAQAEYRAKLSELAFSARPLQSLATSGILTYLENGSPHALANTRLLGELIRWGNLKDARDLERFTDEQLREAARALDPIAR